MASQIKSAPILAALAAAAFVASPALATKSTWDVKLSGAGTLMLMHDDMVDRTTNATGRVAGLTWGEIARLDAVSQLPLIYPHWHQAASANDRLGAAELSLLHPYIGQQ